MAKKEEKKLRSTNGSFEMVGHIRINEKSFSNATSDGGFTYERFSASINTGGGNSPFIGAMGGAYLDNPSSFVFNKNNKDKRFEIAWEDRHNEELLKKVSNFNKIKIGVTRDEEDKIIFNEYLSWYDAIEELKDNKDDLNGAFVKIRGKISWNEYNGDINPQFEIQSLYFANEEKDESHATFKQDIVLDSTALDKSVLKILKNYGKGTEMPEEVEVKCHVMDYENKEKAVIPYQTKYLIKLSDMSEKFMFNVLRKYIVVGKDKLRVLSVTGDIVNGQSTRNATLEDYDDELLELYDDDMKDELTEYTVIEGDSNSKYLTIKRLGLVKDKDSQKMKVKKSQTGDENFPYEPEDLIFVSSIKEVENIEDELDDDDIELDDLDLDLDLDDDDVPF